MNPEKASQGESRHISFQLSLDKQHIQLEGQKGCNL